MANQTFLEKVGARSVLLGDGAMGTELQRRGFVVSGCMESANVINPELVQGIYCDYYNAGSQIVETNSFGANRIRLQRYGLSQKIVELNRLAVELAKAVRPKGCFIGGSIGPTGSILEPFGDLKLRIAYDAFAEQAEALAGGGADVIYVETMSALDEVEVVLRAVKERTGLPTIVTMVFKAGRTGLRTSFGVDVVTAVQKLSEFGADVIGANCGDPEDIIVAIREMRPLTAKPIIAQPNAGIPELVDGTPVYRQTPEALQFCIEQLLKTGVNIIGGCCGVGPAHIRAMRQLMLS